MTLARGRASVFEMPAPVETLKDKLEAFERLMKSQLHEAENVAGRPAPKPTGHPELDARIKSRLDAERKRIWTVVQDVLRGVAREVAAHVLDGSEVSQKTYEDHIVEKNQKVLLADAIAACNEQMELLWWWYHSGRQQ